jgi:hypothetical protein
VGEGRDYTLDAPLKQDDEQDGTPRNNTGEIPKIDAIIPVVKSPGQVAAEKAAEWKRQ